MKTLSPAHVDLFPNSAEFAPPPSVHAPQTLRIRSQFRDPLAMEWNKPGTVWNNFCETSCRTQFPHKRRAPYGPPPCRSCYGSRKVGTREPSAHHGRRTILSHFRLSRCLFIPVRLSRPSHTRPSLSYGMSTDGHEWYEFWKNPRRPPLRRTSGCARDLLPNLRPILLLANYPYATVECERVPLPESSQWPGPPFLRAQGP